MDIKDAIEHAGEMSDFDFYDRIIAAVDRAIAQNDVEGGVQEFFDAPFEESLAGLSEKIDAYIDADAICRAKQIIHGADND